MTGRTDLDRDMAAYFESRSTYRAPEGLLDAAMTRVETTRQRPGWVIPDRWLSPGVRTGVARAGRLALVLAVLASLVAIAIAIGILIGSRPKLPPPFGLAEPGLIALERGGDIFVVNKDGTGMTQLTSGPSFDINPRFSPDGTRIAYQSSMALVVMDTDGSHPIMLEDQFGTIGDFSWAPDSRRIAFGARQKSSDSWRIYVADLDHPGANPLGTADTFGEQPSWSPDGTVIAFKRSHPCCGPSGLLEALWLVGADGSNPRQLWQGDLLDADWGTFHDTAWSPDSTRLAFIAHGVNAAYDIFVVNRDGTGAQNITQSAWDESSPSWSPDGKRVAFYAWDGSDALVVVDPDGSNRVRSAYPYINGGTPVWSPNAKRLIGYEYNPNLNYSDAVVIFDPMGIEPPITIPADNVGSASWQRAASP